MANALERASNRALPAKIGAWVENTAGAALRTRSGVIERTEQPASRHEPEREGPRGTAVLSANRSPAVWTAAPTRTRPVATRRKPDVEAPPADFVQGFDRARREGPVEAATAGFGGDVDVPPEPTPPVAIPGWSRARPSWPRSLFVGLAVVLAVAGAWIAGRATAVGQSALLHTGLTPMVTATLQMLAAVAREPAGATASAPSAEGAIPSSSATPGPDVHPSGESAPPPAARARVTQPARAPKKAPRSPVDILGHSE